MSGVTEYKLKFNIAAGLYDMKGNLKQTNVVYRAERQRVEDLFKKDVLSVVGLENHPKRDKAFELAWEYGHSSGYCKVLIYLWDIAGLLKDAN
ncbi:hypothetical protein LCGC14_1933940 [marine sediment metagenome]|uniref:Uncharacterized protein n=1 Tax=marine sediment metagenome TaxID=412755 RepID=A0A0F9FMN3_9ZZZZ